MPNSNMKRKSGVTRLVFLVFAFFTTHLLIFFVWFLDFLKNTHYLCKYMIFHMFITYLTYFFDHIIQFVLQTRCGTHAMSKKIKVQTECGFTNCHLFSRRHIFTTKFVQVMHKNRNKKSLANLIFFKFTDFVH